MIVGLSEMFSVCGLTFSDEPDTSYSPTDYRPELDDVSEVHWNTCRQTKIVTEAVLLLIICRLFIVSNSE